MTRNTHTPHILAAAALSVLAPLGCTAGEPAQAPVVGAASGQQAAATESTRLPDGLAPVPGIRQPKPGLYTAGQPQAGQWRGIADAGVATVINLRPDAELEGRDARAEVDAAGMRYVHIPVAGKEDITDQNADALASALRQADGPVLVHCASGNRVGALLALGAVRAGMPVEEAIAYGRSAGMASAEAAVRERIAQDAAAD